jgi:ATP-dependent Clp protease, protease subunit
MRRILLFSAIHQDSSKAFIEKILELDAENNDEITVFINSGGGNVTDMFAIIDTMNLVKSPIRTVVMGQAASAAAVIASVGKKRLITKSSKFMIHEVWSGLFGSMTEMERNLKEIKDMQNRLIDVLVKATGQTKEKIEKDIKNNDKYLNAKQAKAYGLVDEILKDEEAQKFKLSEEILGESFDLPEDIKERGLTQVQLLKSGEFSHPSYGEFTLNRSMFESMVNNFETNVRGVDISLDYTHENDDGEQPAACWIKHLEVKASDNGTGLFALCEFTPEGRRKVQEKEYKYASADFVPNYIDESGNTVPFVLRGGTLTNKPFIKGMDPIQLSEKVRNSKGDDMDKTKAIEYLMTQNIDVLELQAQSKTVEDVRKENESLKNQILEIESNSSGSAEELKNAQEKIQDLQNTIKEKDMEKAWENLLNEHKVVPAQKEQVFEMFDSVEKMEAFYKNAPVAIKTKPDGNSGVNSDGLTEEEQAVVSSGDLTKEQILANRTVEA